MPTTWTDQVHMIAVESGSAKRNTRITEERNIYEDYKGVFGGIRKKNACVRLTEVSINAPQARLPS